MQILVQGIGIQSLMVNNNAGKVHIGSHIDAVARCPIFIDHHVEYFHFTCDGLLDEMKRPVSLLERKTGFIFIGHKILHKFTEFHISILPSGKNLR